jgi:hypothetical protein
VTRLEQELIAREIEAVAAHDDPVVARALALIGSTLSHPIRIVDHEEAMRMYEQAGEKMSKQGRQQRKRGLGGFRAPGDPKDKTLYVNRESDQYRAARNRKDAAAAHVMAGILVHEATHDADGEFAARRKEADWLRSKLAGLSGKDRRVLEDRIRSIEAHLSKGAK